MLPLRGARDGLDVAGMSSRKKHGIATDQFSQNKRIQFFALAFENIEISKLWTYFVYYSPLLYTFYNVDLFSILMEFFIPFNRFGTTHEPLNDNICAT